MFFFCKIIKVSARFVRSRNPGEQYIGADFSLLESQTQSIESSILMTTNPCHSADLKDPTLQLSNQLYFEVQTQNM